MSRAGEFATARRGGLTEVEIREIEAHRLKDRPTPWNALARRYGRCEADLRAVFDPPVALPVAIPPKIVPPQAAAPVVRNKTGRKVTFWSDARVALLVQHYIYGDATAAQMATILGTTRGAITSKASAFGGKSADSPLRRAA